MDIFMHLQKREKFCYLFSPRKQTNAGSFYFTSNSQICEVKCEKVTSENRTEGKLIVNTGDLI